MLSDEELDQLAAAVAREVNQREPDASDSSLRVVAKRRFATTSPPGAFYSLQGTHPQWAGMLGTVGFFVDRQSGDLRHISPPEFLHAARIIAAQTGVPFDGELRPAIIEWLLTHQIDESQLRFPRPLRRRWWEFWK